MTRKMIRRNLGDGMDAMHEISRRPPRWLPLWLWAGIAYWPLFKLRHVRFMYRKLKQNAK